MPDPKETETVRVADTVQPDTGPAKIIRNPRVEIIDVFRFFAALWVMLGHISPFPLIDGLTKDSAFGLVVRGIYNNLFVGPPAVIVFFVISGYCIHRPFRDVPELPLVHYFTRRFVRILFPMTCAIILAKPVGFPLPLFRDSILWSLLAELIYYSIYPVLRILARRVNWRSMIIVAYFLATAVVLTKPAAMDYAAYGSHLNWVVGLPCWLLGCLLAQNDPTSEGGRVTTIEIWTWRLGIWGLSVICSILNFHSPITYPWTLNLFALLVYFWIAKEIAFHKGRQASHLLAWAGLWTYSLYLTHRITLAAYALLPTAQLDRRLNWFFVTFAMLLCAYIFYLLFERPGHLLARFLARQVDPRLIVKQNRV